MNEVKTILYVENESKIVYTVFTPRLLDILWKMHGGIANTLLPQPRP